MSKFDNLPSYFDDEETPDVTAAVTVKSEIPASPYDPPKSSNFPLRLNEYQHELIKRGSDKLGTTMVQFVRDAAVEYAKKLGVY